MAEKKEDEVDIVEEKEESTPEDVTDTPDSKVEEFEVSEVEPTEFDVAEIDPPDITIVTADDAAKDSFDMRIASISTSQAQDRKDIEEILFRLAKLESQFKMIDTAIDEAKEVPSQVSDIATLIQQVDRRI